MKVRWQMGIMRVAYLRMCLEGKCKMRINEKCVQGSADGGSSLTRSPSEHGHSVTAHPPASRSAGWRSFPPSLWFFLSHLCLNHFEDTSRSVSFPLGWQSSLSLIPTMRKALSFIRSKMITQQNERCLLEPLLGIWDFVNILPFSSRSSQPLQPLLF